MAALTYSPMWPSTAPTSLFLNQTGFHSVPSAVQAFPHWYPGSEQAGYVNRVGLPTSCTSTFSGGGIGGTYAPIEHSRYPDGKSLAHSDEMVGELSSLRRSLDGLTKQLKSYNTSLKRSDASKHPAEARSWPGSLVPSSPPDAMHIPRTGSRPDDDGKVHVRIVNKRFDDGDEDYWLQDGKSYTMTKLPYDGGEVTLDFTSESGFVRMDVESTDEDDRTDQKFQTAKPSKRKPRADSSVSQNYNGRLPRAASTGLSKQTWPRHQSLGRDSLRG